MNLPVEPVVVPILGGVLARRQLDASPEDTAVPGAHLVPIRSRLASEPEVTLRIVERRERAAPLSRSERVNRSECTPAAEATPWSQSR